MLHQDTKEQLDTAIQYLNTVWLKKDRTRNLEVRILDEEEHRYGYFNLDSNELTRPLYYWEVIEEARMYRLAEWRRTYFKPVGDLIQCSICGTKFQRASQHLAPCVKGDNH